VIVVCVCEAMVPCKKDCMGVMAVHVYVPRMIYSAGLRALPLETAGEKRTRVRNICKHYLSNTILEARVVANGVQDQIDFLFLGFCSLKI